MSIKDQIVQKLKDVGEDQWFRVAFQMTGGHEKATMVMMFAIDELHQAGTDKVQITHPRWRAWGFTRERVGNASMVLRGIGVIYTNHKRLTWHVEPEVFWAAFEAAFDLVFPHMDDDAGNPQGVENPQAPDDGAEGEAGAEPAGNQHPIEIDDSNTQNKPSMAELFERYRLQFTGNLNAQLARLLNAVAALGIKAARVVIHRCMAAGGRTWAYVAKALENEMLALSQPRQLVLLPVDAPSTKLQRDGQKNQFTQPGKWVIDGVEMIRRHKGFGQYEYISVAEYEREQQAAARAALEAERQREALAQTFDDAPLMPVVEESLGYTGEGAAEWSMAYRQLALQFDRQKFQAFVEGSRLVSASAGRFVVAVANDIQRQMLQNRLYRCVKRVLSDACGQPVEIEFVLGAAA
jgi:hypothetical protein